MKPLLVGIVLLGLSSLLFAASPYQHSEGWHGIIGVGVLLKTVPYKDMHNKIWPLPHLIMRRGNFFIEGLEIGYRALESSGGYFDFIITPRLEGFKGDEGSILNDMADRHPSLDGGFSTKWRQGTVELKLSAVTDLLSKSDGEEVTLSLGNTYIVANRMAILMPSLGLKWQSENLVNYYYGVRTSEAHFNRPTYTAEATLNYIAAVNATYLLSKRSTLFMGVEYEHIGDDISDSPLVNEEQIINVFVGYGWQF